MGKQTFRRVVEAAVFLQALSARIAVNGLISPTSYEVRVPSKRPASYYATTQMRLISSRTSHASVIIKPSREINSRGAVLSSSVASTLDNGGSSRELGKFQSSMVRTVMMTYILSMCIALPVTLLPVYLLHKAKLIDRVQKEKMSLKVSQFCSRWLMRIFPFARKRVIVDENDESRINPQPSIWVCNHISMLDLFFVLALDKKMRGEHRRPIKVLYWRGIESNPVTRVLCRMCGFIPVDMADNGNGAANEYDPKSFKQMLKLTKSAISEGFDIGILPEGQPNPIPEQGLQPVFPGAFTLAKMSKRPIQMMSLYGLHKMWHPDESIGMKCTHRDMAARVYPCGRVYGSAEEFTATFEAVVGEFGAHGRDLPEKEMKMWLDGTMWQTELKRREANRLDAEEIIEKSSNKASSGEEKSEVEN